MQQITCSPDGGTSSGSKLGCMLSTPTVGSECLAAVQGTGAESGLTTEETTSCMKGWWIDSTSGCFCESSNPVAECAGGDCVGLGVRGYDEDGKTWWSFAVASSAKLHTMTSMGFGEKGSFSINGPTITHTGNNNRTFEQSVSKCDAERATIGYLIIKKASAGASASFAAAVKQYGAETKFSWKSAPYNP